MKKTLVALAALAVVGAASAQSSVTLYGAVDASYSYMSSGDVSVSKLTSSQLGSSKLGFKGEEDLGGGLKAVFKLEGGINNDSGVGKTGNTNNQASGSTGSPAGFLFNRYALVGLAGNFGEIHLGREYNWAFWYGQGAVDPFGTNGPADSTQMALILSKQAAVNAANMITYISPSMSGFQVGAQAFMGENSSTAANSDDGGGYSLFANYGNGPIFVSGATSTTKYLAGDYTLSALSASYNFGVAKAVYTFTQEKVASATEVKNTTNLIGVIVPMGAANFKASYINAKNDAGGSDHTGELLGLGVDYALSKRTVAYVSYAHVTNGDGGTYATGISDGSVNPTSSNVAIGIKHAF